MRQVKYIVLHTTGGPLNQTVASIQNHWRNVLGWKSPGYHRLITGDANVHELAPFSAVTNGVAGYNANAVHLCTTGGWDLTDTRTPGQIQALIGEIRTATDLFPNAAILGHRDFSTDLNGNGIIEKWEWIKHCPCYDVRDWLATINLNKAPEKVIYKLNYPLVKLPGVGLIQAALNEYGYGLKVDNVFGAKTDIAVTDFQAKRGIFPSGIADNATQKELNISI